MVFDRNVNSLPYPLLSPIQHSFRIVENNFGETATSMAKSCEGDFMWCWLLYKFKGEKLNHSSHPVSESMCFYVKIIYAAQFMHTVVYLGPIPRQCSTVKNVMEYSPRFYFTYLLVPWYHVSCRWFLDESPGYFCTEIFRGYSGKNCLHLVKIAEIGTVSWQFSPKMGSVHNRTRSLEIYLLEISPFPCTPIVPSDLHFSLVNSFNCPVKNNSCQTVVWQRTKLI